MPPTATCKVCGRTALPGQEYCMNCRPAPQKSSSQYPRRDDNRGREPYGSAPREQGSRPYADSESLPGKCIIRDTFYEQDGSLKAEVFIGAAENVAGEFRRAQITQTSLRKLHGMAKQAQLRCKTDRDTSVGFVRETMGKLVVLTDYQVGRRVVRPVFRDWLTQHRDIAMSSVREFCGFVDFFTSIVARLKEKEDRR